LPETNTLAYEEHESSKDMRIFITLGQLTKRTKFYNFDWSDESDSDNETKVKIEENLSCSSN
jgi:hypothetical protein